MSDELNNIQLRSDEVQEILGHIPSRIIRYGVTVIFAVVMLLLGGSYFFKYPDILTAPVEVLSQNAPAPVISKTSGNLAGLFVADSQQVSTNQVLGVIKNPAVFPHMSWLKMRLEQNNNQAFDTLWLQQFPDTLQLGSVQAAYASFLKGASDYQQFLQLDVYGQKIGALYAKKQALENYIQIAQKQVALKQQEFNLTQNKFTRDSLLFTKEVYSLAEYENARKEFLQQGMALESLRSAAVNARMEMQDLTQQIADYQLEEQNQRQGFEHALQEQWQNLASQVETWYDNFVLVAPIKGIVAFNSVWTANQKVEGGQTVFTVLPQAKTEIIGRVNLPVKGAGKVKTGQQVNIKFESFPYQEFGMIRARVASVSLVPAEQNYVVEIQLPDTLLTNYGYLLPFSQKMLGTAEIITEDLPLLVRLFNPLKSLIKNHVRKPYGAVNEKVPSTGKSLKRNDTQPTVTSLSNSSNTTHPLKNYYVIVASYTDDKKAEKGRQMYAAKGYACKLLPKQHRLRLSVFETQNRNEAFEKLAFIRQQEHNESIWLLVADN